MVVTVHSWVIERSLLVIVVAVSSPAAQETITRVAHVVFDGGVIDFILPLEGGESTISGMVTV